MLASQPTDDAPDELLIVADMDRAVGMDHLVVPGRHAPMCLLLARIPVGRDVAVNATENHEDSVVVPNVAPNRIRTGNVSDENAASARLFIQQERQVVCFQACRCVRHQHAQRVVADDAMEFLNPRFGELLRNVHEAPFRMKLPETPGAGPYCAILPASIK